MIICDKNKFVFINDTTDFRVKMTKELQKTYKNTKLLMRCDRFFKNIGIDKGAFIL